MFYTHRTQGFTTIELILVTGIFALVMGVIVSAVLYFYRTNAHTIEQIYAVESARRGVDFLVRDIREAAFSDEGAYPIVSIGENEMLFYSDIDRDQSVERVRYRLSGDLLEKGATNATGTPAVYNDADEVFSVVSTDVQNGSEAIAIFRYFDAMGVEIVNFGNVTDVVFVSVNLIININPTRLPENFVLRSSATLRNLRLGL